MSVCVGVGVGGAGAGRTTQGATTARTIGKGDTHGQTLYTACLWACPRVLWWGVEALRSFL
jgi:hypothetical protein